jgi:hypothetical protein
MAAMQRPTRRLWTAPGWAWLLITLWFTLGLVGAAAAAPKTDILVFHNGDRLTGEVKGLERGQLSFKTDATGTISVEWDKVASLQTNQYLTVETISGLRYFGRVPPAREEGTLRVQVEADSKGWDLPLTDIVRAAPIEKGNLIERLDGYVTAGYDYTKATDLQQFTFTGGLSSRDEKRQWSIDGETTLTSQGRYDASAWNRRFLADRWFVQGFGGFDGNDELGLDMRVTLGAAYGRFLVQDNRQDWAAYAGVALNREDFTDQEVNESVEGVLGTQYWFYHYDAPEASLNLTLNVFPSFTESGRVRSEGRLRARYEIVNDLFFEASVYGSFDNQPGQDADSNSDYGVTTSLGYSF